MFSMWFWCGSCIFWSFGWSKLRNPAFPDQNDEAATGGASTATHKVYWACACEVHGGAAGDVAASSSASKKRPIHCELIVQRFMSRSRKWKTTNNNCDASHKPCCTSALRMEDLISKIGSLSRLDSQSKQDVINTGRPTPERPDWIQTCVWSHCVFLGFWAGAIASYSLFVNATRRSLPPRPQTSLQVTGCWGWGWRGWHTGQSGTIWCYREVLSRINGAGGWSPAHLTFQTMKLPEARCSALIWKWLAWLQIFKM